MDPAAASRSTVRFGVFEVDLRSGELRKNGLRIRLQDQPFQVLAMLLEQPGQIVTREEFRKRVWSEDTFVDFDHSLGTAINKIREALGDSAENPRFVETLHRRGYRFIAPVVGANGIQTVVGATRGVAQGEAAPRPYKVLALAVGIVVVALAALLAFNVAGLRDRLLHRAALPPPELKERRLTFNPSENAVTQGAISPDGKYLAYGDRTGMHLKLIQTGETRTIPQPEGPAPDRAGWFPNGWFPDGSKFIAAGLEAGQRVSGWVISVMGGPPRKLRDDADVWSVSPDGALIAFGTGSGVVRFREIWLMGPQGEEPRRLVPAAENEEFFWAAWSPNGRRIAYKRYHLTPQRLECSLESRNVSGGPPTLILSDQRVCGRDSHWWHPDGRIIFPMAEPEPNQSELNLWGIRVDMTTGAPLDKPRRITNWAGISGLDVYGGTTDGKQLIVWKASGQEDVYVGELEANGRRLKQPSRLTLDDRNDLPGAWTSDSKAVLFISDRNDTWGIYKQRLDQTVAEAVVTGSDYKDCPVASPDGSWILYLSKASPELRAATPVRIMRVPTSGGAPELVLEGRGIEGESCARSPATLCVFTEQPPDQKQIIFSAFDPVQGRGQELTRVNIRQPASDWSWDLSPDGSRIAFTQLDRREGRIQLLPLGGGEAREIVVKDRAGLITVRWAADGKGVLVAAWSTTLIYVDMEGRANVFYEQRNSPVYTKVYSVPSPDGRYAALLRDTQEPTMWMLENF